MKPPAKRPVDYFAGNAVPDPPGYRHRMNVIRPVGDLIRDWRHRRGLTQLHLADLADISTRHVSFIETGRSLPSRATLLRLAERLEVPLRERNVLMTAAGLAPIYAERRIKDDPALAQARSAVELVLRGHEPYPAIAVDRHWNLLARNRALGPLHGGAAAFLSEPPLNVLRVSLHPEGLAPRIVNLGEWRAHLLNRLRHQADATGDPVLHALHEELSGYPGPDAPEPRTSERPELRRTDAPAHATGCPFLHQHHDRVRHPDGRHPSRTGDRILLPRRPSHRDTVAEGDGITGVAGRPLGTRAGAISCTRKRTQSPS